MLALRERGEAPWPGLGPPKATRQLYWAEIIAVGQGESGAWAHARWTSGCAYEVSAMVTVAGALVLAEELSSDAGRAGLVTPAMAFHGTTWVDRILKAPRTRDSHA